MQKRRRVSKYKILSGVRVGVSYLALIVFAIFAVFPIYYIVITSLSPIPSLASISISSLIPKTISLQAYYSIIFQNPFPLWLRNSLILAGSTVVLSIFIAFTSGLALSRFGVRGKKALIVFIYILTFFPFTATAIPLYLLFAKFHLIDTYYGLILAYSGGTSVFGAYLVKIFLDTIPKDYEEAAMVDGLGRFQAFMRVLLPMARPIIAFIALLGFLGAYTDYALANLFITSGNLWTLTLGMYYLGVESRSTLYNVFAAFAVLMGIPIFIIFMTFQKYLTKIYSLSGTK
ncbi:sugar ABC transporter permease [Sulfolobales archaeon HS-7]|nr:sugar ABC transporter permease [Sulfolobales archaeon HS-7]